MTIRIGINGFGRIGRLVYRAAAMTGDFEIVAINDLVPADNLAYLLQYDTMHGRFAKNVEVTADGFDVEGMKTNCLSERDPSALPWGDLGVDYVLESTGFFTDYTGAHKHVEAGAKRVLISAPTKTPDEVPTFVYKVNSGEYDPANHTVLSNASCTTNCLAPLAKVLHNAFGIKRGLMNTIHAYTNDQRILDLPHSDLRRARSAACNIIPTSTGAARAVGKVLPELAGKLDGMSMRVPVPCGSVVDLVCEIEKDSVTVAEINAAVKAEAEGAMKGVLEYSEDALVSSDIVRNPHSSIFDAGQTMVMDGNMIKVVSWYDNEWGYSNRVCDLIFKAHSI